MSAWKTIDSAPREGTLVWVATTSAICPAYFAEGAWRNWFKGCNYDTPKPLDAFLPDRIWFEPTHWQNVPAPPQSSESNARIVAGPEKVE